jgi:hypothetical protein
MTPTIKSLLREKNFLMRKGKLEQANALADRIGTLIIKGNTEWLSDCDPRIPGGAKAMWNKVNEITGSKARPSSTPPDPAVLNAHYAATSTDPNYSEPLLKSSCAANNAWPSEQSVFYALDHLKQSDTGLDGLPTWFLRLAAPGISMPLTYLYRLSMFESKVPTQWKSACITPVPKIAAAVNCSDFRPISITPVLSRLLEKLITRDILYSMLTSPALAELLTDQYAFRPTGSTTAAIIAILSDLTHLINIHPYVHVIGLDFSKAFDTVRHSTLMEKLAAFPIDDQVYNWIANYLCNRTHCTKVQGVISPPLPINASIVQGSAIGPVAFILNATDLRASKPGNKLHKYADDTYLIVPANNSHTIASELDHIATWASVNNLRLNPTKSTEMVIRSGRNASQPPPPLPSISRVKQMEILGVTIQDNLGMDAHTRAVVGSACQNLYALKILKAHGLPTASLYNVCQATLVSRMTYAAPAWYGFTKAADRTNLQAVLTKATRWGLNMKPAPQLDDLVKSADHKLFRNILSFTSHVLHSLLPPVKQTAHNLRRRTHGRILPVKTTSTERNFFIRMLYG